MSNRCRVCEKNNSDEAKYCKKCGTFLSTTTLEMSSTKQGKTNNATQPGTVITDINIPFSSMIVLMVKWTIASIPALLILVVLGAIVIGMLGGLGAII